MTNYEIFCAGARNIENLSHFYGTRTSILSWMHAKSMPDGGRRKGMSNLTLFLSGIKSIGDELKRRIRRLKHSVNTRHETILSDPYVVTELSRLHENFVIVPADKAYSNYTFVCKRYYVDILIEELGLHLLPGNPTYNRKKFSASEVLDNHKSVLTTFGMQRRMKSSICHTFIGFQIGTKIPLTTDSKCSTKPLFLLLTQ